MHKGRNVVAMSYDGAGNIVDTWGEANGHGNLTEWYGYAARYQYGAKIIFVKKEDGEVQGTTAELDQAVDFLKGE